jgi:hypothetical protein
MNDQSETFTLDKNIWTQDDFDIMGWHDATIRALALEEGSRFLKNNLVLDIDYIFKWVVSEAPESVITFWVAPCTMIFKNRFDLEMDFEGSNCGDLMDIAGLHLKDKVFNKDNSLLYAGLIYEWAMELHQGLISLKSDGFEQIVRRNPIYTPQQVLSMEERGGISFERTPCGINK